MRQWQPGANLQTNCKSPTETDGKQTGTHPITPSIPAALKFLQSLINSDIQCGYSAI